MVGDDHKSFWCWANAIIYVYLGHLSKLILEKKETTHESQRVNKSSKALGTAYKRRYDLNDTCLPDQTMATNPYQTSHQKPQSTVSCGVMPPHQFEELLLPQQANWLAESSGSTHLSSLRNSLYICPSYVL